MQLAEELKANGCPKVVINDLARCDWAEAVEDAFRYSKLVLATTTYNADIFPFMRQFIDHLTERNYSNRTVAFMENGSWAPVAAKIMKGMFEKSKDLTFAENTVKIMSALNAESTAQLSDLAKELAGGKVEAAPEATKGEAKRFECSVCGYIYEGEELPEDFICPICQLGAEVFEEIE